jgi:hypothetical protein
VRVDQISSAGGVSLSPAYFCRDRYLDSQHPGCSVATQ